VRSSSERVGALAAALAKAQAEIANPEKSLISTIVSPFPREGSRTFRYASLSSGLDLVRKCLGQQEIAVVQATALDQDLIRLTTTLVHSSGEWVSSDWPVCPVSETAVPHRLGAALTYARRYALFTLVGIAGEDDLDAPDLSATAIEDTRPNLAGSEPVRPARTTAGEPNRLSPTSQRRGRSDRANTLSVPAGFDRNALDRAIAQLAPLSDPEALAVWAHKVLLLKNQLSKEDAQGLEDAFVAKLNELSSVPNSPQQGDDRPKDTDLVQVTTIIKPRRERDRDHLRFVATHPCLICARMPSDAHHLKFAERPAMGRKVSDKFTVPLCRLHHRDLHKRGNERSWWEEQGIDPLPIAADLWRTSHPDSCPGEAADLSGNHTDAGPVVQRRHHEMKPIVSSQIT
jgi:ERF superfamily